MPPTPSRTSWVVVANGTRFLIFENTGADRRPKLTLRRENSAPRLSARDLASDRPGRRADPGPGQRSAMEEADPAEAARTAFVTALGARLTADAEAGRVDGLVVIAPPRTLGILRDALGPAARGRVLREIDKDLTAHTVQQIETEVGAAFWD